MEKQGLRDLIRDYTHGKGCILNSASGLLAEKAITVDTVMELFETDLKTGVKDSTRSMINHGLNKLFTPDSSSQVPELVFTFYEK